MVGKSKTNLRFWQRAGGAMCVLLVFALAERRADASEPFPPILAKKLGMECVPNCLPCHLEPVGTSDNQRADGIKGEIERIAAGDVSSEVIVAAALDQLLIEQPNLDSDADGEQDIAELSAGQNPYGGKDLCERPLYGCFASHVSPTLPTRLGALAAGLAVAGALMLRRRQTLR